MLIAFKILKNGDWKMDREVVVNPAEPCEAERLAVKYLQRGQRIFDSKARALMPTTCFDRVTSDGTNTIFVAPLWPIEKSRPEEEERPAKRRKRIEHFDY